MDDNYEAIFRTGLVDDPAVWRQPLLIPGKWEQPPTEDVAKFLARLTREQHAAGHSPLPLLFRPLAARRLQLQSCRVNLWQVALNIDLDVGALDVVEQRTPQETMESGTPEPLQQAELTQSLQLLTNMLPGYLLRSRIGEDQPKAPSPRDVVTAFQLAHSADCTDLALDHVTLALGLARRQHGRLRVVYPGDVRALVGPQADACAEVAPPVVARAEAGVRVVVTVAYGSGAYEVSVLATGKGLAVEHTRKIRELPDPTREIAIGPVRVSTLPRTG